MYSRVYLSCSKHDMKRIILSTAIVAAIYFSACNNNTHANKVMEAPKTESPSINGDALIGKWHMVNSVPKKPDPQMPQELITRSVIDDSDYWEFKPGNVTTSKSTSLHLRAGKYTLTGDHMEINMVNIPSEEYTILKVDDKQLLLLTGVMQDTWYFEKAK